MLRKTLKVIVHEYTRHVLRKRFLFALLSVPLWILISIGAGFLSIALQMSNLPVGYVDQAGLLDDVDVNQVSTESMVGIKPTRYVRFEDEPQARDSLQGKKISAYFVIPEDYRTDPRSRLVYQEEPFSGITSEFADVLRAGLLRGQNPAVANRLLKGPDLEIEATQDNREQNKGDWFKVAAPIIAGVFLMVSVFTSGGYLMQAVVEEKENRTMELLVTSLSPLQIMGGKITALISVGLTQVFAWSIFPFLVIILARAYVPFLQQIAIDWKLVGLLILVALPTFLLIAALMATIGATVTDAREGQQTSSIVTLPAMAPLMIMPALMNNPGGALAVGLSFFPLTAGLTILLRMAFSSVPDWQVAVSVGILLLSAIGAVWLSGKIFRIGMLRYGKRMSLKEIMQAFKARPTDDDQRRVPNE